MPGAAGGGRITQFNVNQPVISLSGHAVDVGTAGADILAITLAAEEASGNSAGLAGRDLLLDYGGFTVLRWMSCHGHAKDPQQAECDDQAYGYETRSR